MVVLEPTLLQHHLHGGKWYCEFYLAGSVGNYAYVGYYPVIETPEVKKQWSVVVILLGPWNCKCS